MSDLAAALAAAFPEQDVEAVETIRQGNHKQTAVVKRADAETVVLQQSARPESLRTEVALARAIAERTSIPVPAVLASEDTDGVGYAVVEHVPGEDLHEQFTVLSADERRGVARTFGRTLAVLHETFTFDAYGPVEAREETLQATGPTDWPTWFRAYAQEGIDALPAALGDFRDQLRTAVDEAALPATPPARLYPWDLRPGNALVRDGAVAAVLDWGGPLSAAPALAVAKTEHLVADWYVEDPQPLREAFRAGYRAVRALPEVPTVYRLVAVVCSAVDSRGEVTRPGYPEQTGEAAVAFHRERLRSLL